jgi:hypothetical protein
MFASFLADGGGVVWRVGRLGRPGRRGREGCRRRIGMLTKPTTDESTAKSSNRLAAKNNHYQGTIRGMLHFANLSFLHRKGKEKFMGAKGYQERTGLCWAGCKGCVGLQIAKRVVCSGLATSKAALRARTPKPGGIAIGPEHFAICRKSRGVLDTSAVDFFLWSASEGVQHFLQ